MLDLFCLNNTLINYIFKLTRILLIIKFLLLLVIISNQRKLFFKRELYCSKLFDINI